MQTILLAADAISRRECLTRTVSTGAAILTITLGVASLADVAIAIVAHKTITLDVSTLSVGASTVTSQKINGAPVLVTRTSESSFRALSMKCTHKGCALKSVGGVLDCPCHHSKFNPLTGAPIKGPAKKPLVQLSADFDPSTGQVTVSG